MVDRDGRPIHCTGTRSFSSSNQFGTTPAPPADCFVGHDDSSSGEQILDISETDTESVVQPDGVADDFGGIAVSVMKGPCGFHAPFSHASAQVDSTPRPPIITEGLPRIVR